MNKTFKTLMIALLVLGSACATQAQDDEEKKIKIKITKKVDGEQKTFESEYASEEEMRNDPEYKEFADAENDFEFFFDGNAHERVMEIHKDGALGHAFSFDMGDDESFSKGHARSFKFKQGGPNVYWFGGDEDAMINTNSWNSEEFGKELEEKMKNLEEKLKNLDKTLQADIMKSMKDIQEMHMQIGKPRMIRKNSIRIEDVGMDFGKRGKVEAKDKLEMDGINFMVMNDRLTLRFRVKNESELTVKISNEAGKDIYNRYYEKFDGTFSDSVDFSKYAGGKYLLEITDGKKRLTKMIVID